MQLSVVQIGTKSSAMGSKAGYESLFRLYFDRLQSYFPSQAESFAAESSFLEWLAKQHKRVPAVTVLLDSRGRPFGSSELAGWVGSQRDQGAQRLVFAVGPADGWSDAAKSQAKLLLSFGPITMPHEMARLVLAEQLYRACTILAGHPYHCGH